jgi:hypothetical protein
VFDSAINATELVVSLCGEWFERKLGKILAGAIFELVRAKGPAPPGALALERNAHLLGAWLVQAHSFGHTPDQSRVTGTLPVLPSEFSIRLEGGPQFATTRFKYQILPLECLTHIALFESSECLATKAFYVLSATLNLGAQLFPRSYGRQSGNDTHAHGRIGSVGPDACNRLHARAIRGTASSLVVSNNVAAFHKCPR